MKTKAEIARDLFLEGYNCSQAVFGAFCEDFGISFKDGVILSSGFGGGFARKREVCGAISGGVMVLSLLHEYSDPADRGGKVELYLEIRDYISEFESIKGSIVCRELLSLLEKSSTPVPEERTPDYYKKRPCAANIYLSAQLIEEHLARQNNADNNG